MITLNVHNQWEFKKIRGKEYLIIHHFEGGTTKYLILNARQKESARKRFLKSMKTVEEPKKLTQAKKAGLKVTDIDPAKNKKLKDFIELTEGNKTPLEQAYQKLGMGAHAPKDKKLKQRFEAARNRLRKQGLL